MYFKPHKLYIHKSTPSYQDENGDWQEGTETVEYLCDCFLHDISITEQAGLAGIGIKATKKINLDRNDSLKLKDTVEVREKKDDSIRSIGTIEDIRHTSSMGNNYTQIFYDSNKRYKNNSI